MPGFAWAGVDISKGLAKVCISDETFWITDCERTTIQGQVAFKGKVGNDVDVPGLLFGDEVYFVPTIKDE